MSSSNSGSASVEPRPLCPSDKGFQLDNMGTVPFRAYRGCGFFLCTCFALDRSTDSPEVGKRQGRKRADKCFDLSRVHRAASSP